MNIIRLKNLTFVVLLIASNSLGAGSIDGTVFMAGLNRNYTLVQMSKIATGHDVLKASINGQTGWFIVDTGAISIINERLLNQYYIDSADKIKTQQAAGAGGLIEIDSYPIDELLLAGHQVPIKQVGSTDLDTVTLGLYNATGKMIDGLIGQDVLIAMQAVIDVAEQRLYIKNQQVNHPVTGESERLNSESITHESAISELKVTALPLVPLRFKDYDLTFLTIEVTINNQQGLLIIDSGASRTMLSSSQLTDFGLGAAQVIDVQSSSGAGGAFSLQHIKVPAIAVGGFTTGQAHIFHHDLSPLIDFITSQTGVKVAGVIGQDILLKHQALIDVGGRVLYLKE